MEEDEHLHRRTEELIEQAAEHDRGVEDGAGEEAYADQSIWQDDPDRIQVLDSDSPYLAEDVGAEQRESWQEEAGGTEEQQEEPGQPQWQDEAAGTEAQQEEGAGAEVQQEESQQPQWQEQDVEPHELQVEQGETGWRPPIEVSPCAEKTWRQAYSFHLFREKKCLVTVK